MGHHHTALTKLQKFRQYFFNGRRIDHHGIIDTGQLLNTERNWHFLVDKSGKTVCDLTFFYFYSTDFNDLTGQSRETSCLNIKNNKIPIQSLAFGICNHSFQIIDQISFHAIEHLEIRLFRHTSTPGIKAMVRLRERLYNPMVCDGNCLMPPLIGSFYQCFCICDTIHITHLGMAVQLHSLLRTGICSCCCKICYFLDSCNISDGQLTVKSVNSRNALQFQESSLLNTLCHFRNLFITQEHLYHNTVCKICHRKNENSLFISDLTFLHIHNLTADDHLTHLTGNTLQRDRFSVEISAVNNIRITVSPESETAAEVALLAFLLLLVKRFLLI